MSHGNAELHTCTNMHTVLDKPRGFSEYKCTQADVSLPESVIYILSVYVVCQCAYGGQRRASGVLLYRVPKYPFH